MRVSFGIFRRHSWGLELDMESDRALRRRIAVAIISRHRAIAQSKRAYTDGDGELEAITAAVQSHCLALAAWHTVTGWGWTISEAFAQGLEACSISRNPYHLHTEARRQWNEGYSIAGALDNG